MKIIVTGGNGFIGRYVIPLLNRHEVLLLGTRNVSGKHGNLRHLAADLERPRDWQEDVRSFSPDACIHLAWQGLPDYSLERCSENFHITTALFDFLGSVGCQRLFCAGTCWEYGNLLGEVGESDSPDKMSLFASFKAALCRIGKTIAAQYSMDFIWGRIFFVYGTGQRKTSLIPYCHTALRQGKVPEIKSPHAINDYIHVTDIAEAVTALIESNGLSGVFNIGSGRPVRVIDMVSTVAKVMQCDLPDMDAGVADGQVDWSDGFWADISRIKAKTGWVPRVSLEDGIRDTIRDLKETDEHV